MVPVASGLALQRLFLYRRDNPLVKPETQQEIDEVLAFLTAHELDVRINALKRSQELYHQIFAECVDPISYASCALRVEMLYNKVRAELKQDRVVITNATLQKSVNRAGSPKVTKAKKTGRLKKTSSVSDILASKGFDLNTLIKQMKGNQ